MLEGFEGRWRTQAFDMSGLSMDDEDTDVGSEVDRADLVVLKKERPCLGWLSEPGGKGGLNINLAPGLACLSRALFCELTGIKALGGI